MWDKDHGFESFEGVPRDFLDFQQYVVPRVRVGFQVQGWENQGVCISCDLSVSRFGMI